jgi:hypothetical protein
VSLRPIAIPVAASPLDIRRLHSDCEPVALGRGPRPRRYHADPIDPNEAHAARPIPIVAPRQQQIPDLTDTFED